MSPGNGPTGEVELWMGFRSFRARSTLGRICVNLRPSAVKFPIRVLIADIRSLPRRRLGGGGSIRGSFSLFVFICG
jgi:hypothetical protein